MVSDLLDLALAWGFHHRLFVRPLGGVSRLLDAVGVPDHRVRAAVGGVLAVLGAVTLAGAVTSAL